VGDHVVLANGKYGIKAVVSVSHDLSRNVQVTYSPPSLSISPLSPLSSPLSSLSPPLSPLF
jgi:hypothetical protein